ncbi:MAG: ACT domain-containing protein [Clostridia bacterium]|nr:ACT domain-containing protein [Clostridia bacterium]
MKAFITVIGNDKVGIIAKVSTFLADLNINIEDISQTVLQGKFTMIMAVDTALCELPFEKIAQELTRKGEEIGTEIVIRSGEIFDAMHRI